MKECQCPSHHLQIRNFVEIFTLLLCALPRRLVFFLRHLPLTGRPADTEWFVDVVQNVGDCQTSLQFVSKQPASPARPQPLSGVGGGAGVVVVVGGLGDVDDTHGSNVKTVLTGWKRATLGPSPDFTGALASLQAYHGLTPVLVPLEAAGHAQTRYWDCQCQRSTATQKSLSCSFLLHPYLAEKWQSGPNLSRTLWEMLAMMRLWSYWLSGALLARDV